MSPAPHWPLPELTAGILSLNDELIGLTKQQVMSNFLSIKIKKFGEWGWGRQEVCLGKEEEEEIEYL